MASISLTTVAEIAAVTSAAGGAASAYETRQAGVAQSKQDRQKARVEADNETQKQIAMRQKLLAGLATQNAQAGVGGIGTGRGTSFGANVNRQITQAQNDLMVSQANSSTDVSLLDQEATNAGEAGSINAASGLLNTAGTFLNSPGGKAL
jgi:uncharacterized protein (UPF0261 family)